MSVQTLIAALKSKRGDDYVTTARLLAMIAADEGARIKCAYCPNDPVFIGTQGCGEPGPFVCATCWHNQQAFMLAASGISGATPYCRHCDQNVTADHISVVPIWL